MSKKLIIPLAECVPAANGSSNFLPSHGMVRELDSFWIKLQQNGSVALVDLPAKGMDVHVRIREGAPYKVDLPNLSDKPKRVAWSEVFEALLSDGVIELVPAEEDSAEQGEAHDPVK